MKYFVAWTYKGTIMHSDIYDFKYYIEDVDDFDYLKAAIAKHHTYQNAQCNPGLINLINFTLLDEKPPIMDDTLYRYSIAYTGERKINDKYEFCILQKMLTFNTEIKTENEINTVLERLKEEEDEDTRSIYLLSYTLIEMLEDNDNDKAQD